MADVSELIHRCCPHMERAIDEHIITAFDAKDDAEAPKLTDFELDMEGAIGTPGVFLEFENAEAVRIRFCPFCGVAVQSEFNWARV